MDSRGRATLPAVMTSDIAADQIELIVENGLRQAAT